jgi:hypothetical protein
MSFPGSGDGFILPPGPAGTSVNAPFVMSMTAGASSSMRRFDFALIALITHPGYVRRTRESEDPRIIQERGRNNPRV